jgi:uncharacterized protein (TIGR03437 family)
VRIFSAVGAGLFGRIALLLSIPIVASAQTALICTANAGIPPSVRADSVADLVGDIVLNCTGGTPTPAGVPIVSTNVTVFLNVNLTSRLIADPISEALLFIDEPHSTTNPSVPLIPCTGGPTACTVLGTNGGTGNSGPYGAGRGPNVFQGRLTGANQVTFVGVPIDPPGSQTRVMRISNIRANANQLGVSSSATPNQITAYISITGDISVPINNPQQTVAFVQSGLAISGAARVNLSQCQSANPSIAVDPTKPLDSGGQNEAQYSFTFSEGVAGAFKARNIAQTVANTPVNGQFPQAYPADANQNVPGAVYNTETGFFNGGADLSPLPPDSPPATLVFPPLNGLNNAGRADQGTRLYLSFTGVPAAMKMFVPVSVPLTAQKNNSTVQTGVAVLVSTDASGGGAYNRVQGNAAGWAPVQAGLAVYEILYSDAFSIESMTVPVAAAYAVSDSSTEPPAGAEIRIQAGFAPQTTVSVADSTSPLPRFPMASAPVSAFLVQGCGTPDLTLSVAHSGTFSADSTDSTFTLTVRNSGDRATTTAVNVVDTLPAGLTATAISGSGWTCTLSTLTCSRPDSVAAATAYPPITLSVRVAANAPASVTNNASVTGGGETVTNNNSAADSINIIPTQAITVGTSPAGLVFTVDNISYTSPQTFQWRVGSTHTISTISPQTPAGAAPLVFNQWSDAQGISHTITVGSAPATYTATFGPTSTAMQCTANAGVPPTVRAEALADYVGDLILSCTGGTPTPSGTPVPKVDIAVKLNVNVASRLVKGQLTEALLVMDEPHSAIHPTIPLLACGEAGSNNNDAGVCSITGSGAGASTYDGSTGRPNVFQGELTAPDTITWKSVAIDPPGTADPRILRFTNIRANASSLGASLTAVPNAIRATITVTPAGMAIPSDPVTVAFIQTSLTATAHSAVALSQCTTTNGAIAGDASKPLDTGGQNGAQFSVTLKEGYTSAFKVRNIVELLASMTPASPDANQNIPGAIYNTETGFFNGGAGPQSLPQPFPTVLSTAPFSANGLNLAGKADSGSRVYLKFSPVPSGMKLFAPVRVPLTGGPKNGEAVLIATDPAGAGLYFPAAGNQDGLAPLSISGVVAMAVYEITAADQFTLESFTVNIAAAYVAANQPAAGAINVAAGLAPIGPSGAASSFPRFIAGQFTASAFNIQACAQPDLTIALSHTGKFTQGDTGRAFSIVVKNAGQASSTGAVTVTPALPAALTATAISGSGWTCALTPLGCSRSDSLAAGASYPAISLTVDVDPNAGASLSVTASVSGGGDALASNNSASDPTAVISLISTTVGTTPSGLTFTVDGDTYTSAQVFRWPVGATHTIAVSSSQNDGLGVHYAFTRWSDGGATSHVITVTGSPVVYVATFSQGGLADQTISFGELGNRTVGDRPFQVFATSSSGLAVSFAIDSGPATINENVVTLTGPGKVVIRATQPGDSTYAPAPDVVSSFNVTATSAVMSLTLSVSPAAGGSIVATPAPVSGGYQPGTVVQISAVANNGYVFTGFSGDLSGATNPQPLTMSANRTVSANFAPVSAKPESALAFSAILGGALPDPQSIPLDSTAGVSVSVATASGGAWLRAAVSGGAVQVSIDPAVLQSLASGAYLGSVVITGGGATRIISVSLQVEAEAVKITSVVDAAAYAQQPIASEGLYSIFGLNLATHSVRADAGATPATLDGASASIKDAAGVTRGVSLIFVSPRQINFIAPAGMAAGSGMLLVKNSAGQITSMSVEIRSIAPGIFSADMTGKGLAAAVVVRVRPDGSQSSNVAADCSSTPGQCVAIPIDLGSTDERVYLSLYGTGIRGRSSLSATTVSIASAPVDVLYAGSQIQYPGLDQINVPLPATLAGSGEVDVSVTVDGRTANTVRIAIR